MKKEEVRTYIMVDHIHYYDDLLIRIYSELDGERCEIRKIEIFNDGRIGYAYDNVEVGPTGLGEVPVPPLDEIAQDPYEIFFPKEITKDEFEKIWNAKVP